MITKIKQTKFYNPDDKTVHGNCMQAAVASILGLQLDDVPDFFNEHQEAPDGWHAFYDFMESKGYWAYEYYTKKDYQFHPDVYYLDGDSARGCRHACVYRGGELVHDPHPSNAGLLNVIYIHILCAIDPSAMRSQPSEDTSS
jgi:hypothetical protein